MVCILVVFCIHTIWQTVQENYVRPKIKNTNAEIEKYKAIISQQQKQPQNISRSREEENPIQIQITKLPEEGNPIDLESDLNSFLDSILIENHIEIMPVI